jgi:hypothetical protein
MGGKKPTSKSDDAIEQSGEESSSYDDSNEYSSDQSSDEFEVEKILGCQIDPQGRRRFLVKWQGYPKSENLWVDERNLNCDERIEEFLRNEKALKDRIAPEGQLIKPPVSIVGHFDYGDRMTYECRYEDGHIATLSSDQIIKLNPDLFIDFLEHLAIKLHCVSYPQF